MKKNKRKQIERERLSLSLTVQRQVFFDMGFALLPTNHNLLVAHLHAHLHISLCHNAYTKGYELILAMCAKQREWVRLKVETNKRQSNHYLNNRLFFYGV